MKVWIVSSRRWRSTWLVALLATSLLPAVTTAAGESPDDLEFFETRVRPLLVKHCLKCHGAKKQEAGLRLDSRAGWQTGGDRGRAIVAGRPDASLLIQAVRHEDPDLRMPPDKKLTAAEIADLESWVQRGARDPRMAAAKGAARMSVGEARTFWSFQPIRHPPVPREADDGWSRTPIDSFVFARRKQHGLTAVGEADRRTLIRRATFDLTGLPPTREAIAAFLGDRSPDAFSKLVDRLLSSPAYGERWGRHWLDIARYADTAGDGADYPVREAVKYRDWVISAFNADLPFNRFVRQQVAGDLLASRLWRDFERSGNDDVKQAAHIRREYARLVTATGFLAIGKRYGYNPSPDYQHLDFADVIDSVGRSLLGLSLGCARCHDHKYDPVSAADYYALYGILQSTKWSFPGGEEHKRPANLSPLVPPSVAAQLEQAKAEQLARLDAEITRLKQQRNQLDPARAAGSVDLGLEAQTTGKPPGKPWVHAGPIEVRSDAQSPYEHVHPPGTRGVRLGSGKPTDGLRYVFPEPLRATPGRQMHFTIDFRSVAGAKQKGAYRFYLGRGVVQSLAVECSVTATEFAIRNGSKWEVIRRVQPDQWYTLRLTLDPAKRTYAGIVGTPDDLTSFENKAVGPNWDGVADCFICDAFGHVGGPACGRDLDNLGLRDTPFAAPGSKVAGRVDKGDMAAVNQQRIAALDRQLELLAARRKQQAAKAAYEVAYGVGEATPADARIQLRGEPHRLGEPVSRRLLEVLGGDPVPSGSGSGRLQLADWLTRSSNPLTARVFVNRVWQWHFGSGLVTTPSDFGSRGTPPSHPELLDWLTAEFVAAGWSVKRLHRQIMLSRTYQLAGDDLAENLRIDPGNRWLWRFARRPLDAESIRDAMLSVSGGLNGATPGPHPFPPVEKWGYTIHHPFHAVYDSNHRSVYLMRQRNRRHPFLALFDSADPNLSVAARQPTTTPTQALFLMNSPFVHAQAELFAGRIRASGAADDRRVRWAFEAACGRVPPPAEVQDAVAFVTAYRSRAASADASERVAWAALARVLLTSNAFLYVD